MKKLEKLEPFTTIKENMFLKFVCSKLDVETLTREVNRREPSGTENGWHLSDRENQQPIKCQDGKGTHYVFVC